MAQGEAPPSSFSAPFESPSQSSVLTRFAVTSKRPSGGVAQLVERFGRIEEARGSIPLTSTSVRTVTRCRHILKFSLSVLILLLLTAGCAESSAERPFSGLEADQPERMPDSVLVNTDGQPFAMRTDTEGSVRLVYFGFTSCPDICPVHLAQLSDVLARPGMPPNIKVLFVTVDPDTDTPQVIRDFLNQFSAEFIGLTGTKEKLIEVQRQFSALVASPAVDENGDVQDIGHDGRVFAFAPDGLGRTQYPHPTRQTTWTRDLPILATLR